MLKFGIIGAGGRGSSFAKMVMERHDAEIVALFDLNLARMDGVDRYLNRTVAHYTELNEMLRQAAPDAVIITSPDYCHEEHAVTALQAGVHVLIDKPLAINVSGCMNIINTAEQTGKTAMIGFNLRHHPVLKELKNIIDSGELGTIFMLENREYYSLGRTYMSRWNRKQEFSGGLWVHKGSHDFDVFHWLLDFPRPVKVSAFAGVNVLHSAGLPFQPEANIIPGPTCHQCYYAEQCPDFYKFTGDMEKFPAMWNEESARSDGYYRDQCMYLSDKDTHDNGIAMVEYDNGARVVHQECFVTPVNDRRYTLCGNRAQAEVSLSERTIKIIPRWKPENARTITVPLQTGGHGGADPMLLDNFIATIRGAVVNTSTTTHGMWSTAVGQAAEIARRENRVVFIEELFKPKRKREVVYEQKF